jgi:outer membrane lipoprotein carrier protein
MRLIKICVLSTLVALSANCYAALQPAAEQLNKLLIPINSLKSRFKQTVFTDKQKVIQQSSGTMEFQRPRSFRWQVENPEQNLIVTNGEKLWNYDVDLEQVTIRNFSANNEVSPVSFLFDDIEKLNSDFNIETKANKNHDFSCFKLTPTKENPSFVSVEVCFKGSHIVSLNLLDHLNQISKFDFDHVQKNVPIANARFDFEPPSNVDVVGE